MRLNKTKGQCVCQTFCCSEKYLKEAIWKKEEFILLTVFSLWSTGAIASGPVVRHSIMAEECCGAELLTSWQLESRESQRACLMLTAFFLLPLLFYLGPTPIGGCQP
jgi:hypothetical protein